ncbi:hypothetical protein GJ496_003227 [Pomphorhynchus laevis]|nr:hypothetical protein GJ496_003227 [Pomphorhynchus laevis]
MKNSQSLKFMLSRISYLCGENEWSKEIRNYTISGFDTSMQLVVASRLVYNPHSCLLSSVIVEGSSLHSLTPTAFRTSTSPIVNLSFCKFGDHVHFEAMLMMM